MRFRPGWVPTLFMVFGVGLTAYLGVWQLGRHYEKQALKADILAGLDQAVLGNDDLSATAAPPYYRKIEVTGRFVEPLALTNGRKEFGYVGYGVVQPFQLDGGPLLLIDRGWVPRDGLERAMAEVDVTGESTSIRGQLRPVEGEPDRKAVPGRDGLPELWPQGSWPALWERVPHPKVDAIVLAGDPILAGEGKTPEPLPVDGYQPFPRMRDSLSYAFQWAIFGTVLFCVWLALGISRGKVGAADG